MMIRISEKPAKFLFIVLALLAAAPAVAGVIPNPLEFTEFSELGFGDRQNTKAWSMALWKGDLYVGTARAHMCMDWAGLSLLLPERYEYPPPDEQWECAPTMFELPLQAEIWRYSPISETWTRVYQSPLIPNPVAPELMTGRDAGFRNMIAFTDPNGEEALYATGITSESLFPGMPPPRILRTTDGENWEPVPQDPGTLLGDLGRGQANFRAATVYKDKLYLVNGNLRGTGTVLESADPAAGNDAYRQVVPPDLAVFEMETYNGYLYLGTGSPDGYQVLKTDATGEPPYDLIPVVEMGGYNETYPSPGVASMFIFRDRLYIGTDKPPELIRINPDDSWDLIVGPPRNTPTGYKEPLSGLGRGVDYLLANHFHRLVEYDGRLLMSTNDATGFLRTYELAQTFLPSMGFDLIYSDDGSEFAFATLTGLEHPFDIVIRVFAATPFGLAAGTSNAWEGLRMYLAQPAPDRSVAAPEHLTLEHRDSGVLLTWKPVSGVSSPRPPGCATCGYRVFRRDIAIGPQFVEIGFASESHFTDTSALSGRVYHYHVVAENENGEQSLPSNAARSPSLRTPVTPQLLLRTLGEWGASWQLAPYIRRIESHLLTGDLRSAQIVIAELRTLLAAMSADDVDETSACGVLPGWRAEDLDLLLEQMLLRITLAGRGLLWLYDLVGVDGQTGCQLDDQIELRDEIVTSCYVREACTSISVGPSFEIDAGGTVLLRAGDHVVLGDGVTVGEGGAFAAATDPLLHD
jgi:hypothetical protein